jgi:hypothetical protein
VERGDHREVHEVCDHPPRAGAVRLERGAPAHDVRVERVAAGERLHPVRRLLVEGDALLLPDGRREGPGLAAAEGADGEHVETTHQRTLAEDLAHQPDARPGHDPADMGSPLDAGPERVEDAFRSRPPPAASPSGRAEGRVGAEVHDVLELVREHHRRNAGLLRGGLGQGGRGDEQLVPVRPPGGRQVQRRGDDPLQPDPETRGDHHERGRGRGPVRLGSAGPPAVRADDGADHLLEVGADRRGRPVDLEVGHRGAGRVGRTLARAALVRRREECLDDAGLADAPGPHEGEVPLGSPRDDVPDQHVDPSPLGVAVDERHGSSLGRVMDS